MQPENEVSVTPVSVQYRWGRQKSYCSANIWQLSQWLLDCEEQLQFTAQTTTHHWILFITTSSMDRNKEKRTKQNLIVHSSKSEAEVTSNGRLHSTCCKSEAEVTSNGRLHSTCCKSEAEVTNNRRLHSTYCNRSWQTWSIVWPLCHSRATCICYGGLSILVTFCWMS